ncbi:MAG: hypothetical protein U5N58_11290 [Actinomycetota bacterium]|nr:hypothetical protein [Actinomycetota bacterium]
MKIKELFTLKKYFKPHKRRFTASILFILFTDLLALLIPWILKLAIDDIQYRPQSANLLTYAALLLTVACLQGISDFT